MYKKLNPVIPSIIFLNIFLILNHSNLAHGRNHIPSTEAHLKTPANDYSTRAQEAEITALNTPLDQIKTQKLKESINLYITNSKTFEESKIQKMLNTTPLNLVYYTAVKLKQMIPYIGAMHFFNNNKINDKIGELTNVLQQETTKTERQIEEILQAPLPNENKKKLPTLIESLKVNSNFLEQLYRALSNKSPSKQNEFNNITINIFRSLSKILLATCDSNNTHHCNEALKYQAEAIRIATKTPNYTAETLAKTMGTDIEEIFRIAGPGRNRLTHPVEQVMLQAAADHFSLAAQLTTNPQERANNYLLAAKVFLNYISTNPHLPTVGTYARTTAETLVTIILPKIDKHCTQALQNILDLKMDPKPFLDSLDILNTFEQQATTTLAMKTAIHEYQANYYEKIASFFITQLGHLSKAALNYENSAVALEKDHLSSMTSQIERMINNFQQAGDLFIARSAKESNPIKKHSFHKKAYLNYERAAQFARRLNEENSLPLFKKAGDFALLSAEESTMLINKYEHYKKAWDNFLPLMRYYYTKQNHQEVSNILNKIKELDPNSVEFTQRLNAIHGVQNNLNINDVFPLDTF